MVRFEFVHSDANSVQLAGSFNSWQPQTMRKQQNPDKALFTLELDLSPGDYEYKFVVDGNWEHDPDQECRENEVGSWNNFVSIDSLKEPQKSFEVERKFAVPKNYSGLLADYGFNRDENVESIRDEYFDTRDYDLLRRDHWLRKRQEKWQLKKRVEDGVYEEIEDEDRIDAVLKNLKQDFEWERCVKFAEIETKRSKFRMNDVIIDVDETNWGFVVGEIEICVENKDQIAETLRKIDDIAKDLGLHRLKCGKVSSYLEHFNKEAYNLLPWNEEQEPLPEEPLKGDEDSPNNQNNHSSNEEAASTWRCNLL